MEGGGGGGMLPSSMGSTGLLGLEMPLHQQQQPQPQKFLHPHHQQHPIFPFQTPQSGSDADHQMRHASSSSSYTPYGARGKQQQLTLSSEDELQTGFGDEGDGARRVSSQSPTPSPWQRMKWTDSMVRLLISVVYRVGDDGGGEGEPNQPHAAVSASSVAKGKKGSAASASATSASALLQKKGKWKSVSRAMMEKGFYVSPQQCEDKFNDLNKRYKRVNDLLGKGTACRVVENQALLDTMDHLSPKAKEEARKLLNSKHLFFREMCAYHHATAAASCAAAASTPPPQMQPPPPPHADQQQLCFHHPPTAVSVDGKRGAVAVEEDGMVTHEEDEDDDDDIDSEEDDEDDDEQEEDDDETDYHHNNKHRAHHGGGHHQQGKREEAEEDEDSKGLLGGPGQAEGAKRARRMFSGASPPLSLSLSSPSSTFTSMQKLKSELMGMAGGEGQRQWLKLRAAELEQQRVGYQSRALQLERQRFKWLRFSTKKEREMERMKLHNDRLRLEIERMLLLLRQKELELLGGGVGGVGGGANNHLEQQQQLMLQPTTNASHKRPTADHHLNASVDHTSAV